MIPSTWVAASTPVDELNVRLDPLLAPRFPAAAVANNGKHTVSDDSSATVTVVPTAAVVALVTVVPAITEANVLPLTVIASASSVPSISASPEIARLAAVISSTVISGVPVRPPAVPVVSWFSVSTENVVLVKVKPEPAQ